MGIALSVTCSLVALILQDAPAARAARPAARHLQLRRIAPPPGGAPDGRHRHLLLHIHATYARTHAAATHARRRHARTPPPRTSLFLPPSFPPPSPSPPSPSPPPSPPLSPPLSRLRSSCCSRCCLASALTLPLALSAADDNADFANKDYFRDSLFAAIRHSHDSHEKSVCSGRLRRGSKGGRQSRGGGPHSAPPSASTQAKSGDSGLGEAALGAAEAAWKQRVSAQRQREGDAVITVQAPSPPERRQNASRGGGGAASEGVTARPPPPVAEGAPGDEEEGRAGSPSTRPRRRPRRAMRRRPCGLAIHSARAVGRADAGRALDSPSFAVPTARRAHLCPRRPLCWRLTQAIHAPSARTRQAAAAVAMTAVAMAAAAMAARGWVGRRRQARQPRRALTGRYERLNELGSPDVPPHPTRPSLRPDPISASRQPSRRNWEEPPAMAALGSARPAATGRWGSGGRRRSGGGKAASSSTTSSFGEDSFRSPPVVVPDDDDDDVGGGGGEDDEDEDGPAAWSAVSVVVIDFSGIPSMDTTALRMLEDVRRELQTRGLKLLLSGCHGAARDLLVRANFFDALGMENVFRASTAPSREPARSPAPRSQVAAPQTHQWSPARLVLPAGASSARSRRRPSGRIRWSPTTGRVRGYSAATLATTARHSFEEGGEASLSASYSGDHGKALL